LPGILATLFSVLLQICPLLHALKDLHDAHLLFLLLLNDRSHGVDLIPHEGYTPRSRLSQARAL
jgi:hypothetical protein